MELDELKHAWQTLGRQLERQDSINLQLFRENKLDKARSSLRPLFWGQIAQILFGVAFILLAVSFWPQHRDVPHLLVAGILVHVYGVATIILAGITLGLVSHIDRSAPVLAIQKQLARLRRVYIINGMVTGLSWWLIWIPVLMVLTGLAGADLYATAPSLIWIGLAVGIVGLLATGWFHRWSHAPRRAEFGKRVDDSAAGGSIRNSQRFLDEIAQFEHE